MTSAALTYQTLPFEALSGATLYALLQLRTQVFVVEQNCVFQDMDGSDAEALHVLAHDAAGALQACARAFAPGVKFEGASIGRVVTSSACRGTGEGRVLVQHAIDECTARWPKAPIDIAAQAHLARFYGSLGFVSYGEPFLEDDIPHQMMRRSGA